MSKFYIKIIVASLLFSLLFTGCNANEKEDIRAGETNYDSKNDYGVFLGINREDAGLLDGYDLVVVESDEYEKEDIDAIHERGQEVYGYLNVGAVENYRDYYDDYEDLTLDVYEDWPDEKWVDVSSPDWQSFLVEDLAKKYAAKGFDGFFLDNCDVYYLYPDEAKFWGLCNIMQGLKEETGLTLIINGGNDFVSRCIEEGLVYFDGVNQETVFSSINFDDETYGRQPADEEEFFRDYLGDVKNAGLNVYLLEYHADSALSKEIDKYCNENGFAWFNSQGLELTGETYITHSFQDPLDT